MTYLLVVEVDKIQSFIMQSARLRQVVGASAMLEDFGDLVRATPREYLGVDVPERDFIATKGGSFRVRLGTEAEARHAGKRLRRRFEEEIGGSITIAEPVRIDDENTAVADGNMALRTTKAAGRDPVPLWHIPFHALCQSSGTELAVAYRTETQFADDRTMKYLGETTLAKGDSHNERNIVLRKWLESLKTLHPDKSISIPDAVTDAETYAWDSRNYVAYIVADGNSMGKIFDVCDLKMAKRLSEQIGNVTRESLAAAVRTLMSVRDPDAERVLIPLLPLIVGGDDVFALLPANWALDVARQYIYEYEARMSALWREIGVFDALRRAYPDEYTGEDTFVATLGVAVVVCKSSYPYKSAHEYGESLLKATKSKGKLFNPIQSMLSIGWIVGSTLPDDEGIESYTPAQVEALLKFRYELRDMPGTVRERLRAALEYPDDEALRTGQERYADLYNAPQLLLHAEDTLGRSGLRDLFNLWDFLLETAYPEAEYTMGAIHAS